VLLEFRFANYKSFADEAVFSMERASEQEELAYSLIKRETKRTKSKNSVGLCSSVVYGPNGAGKSNVVSALNTLRSIVLSGNIRDFGRGETLPTVLPPSALTFVPNSAHGEIKPIELSIKFIEGGRLFEYSIEFEAGLFAQTNQHRKIVAERLVLDKEQQFSRSGTGLEVSDPNDIKRGIAEKSLADDELFLTNGFKTVYDSEAVSLIREWFERKLFVISQAQMYGLVDIMFAQEGGFPINDGVVSILPFSQAVKAIGGITNELGVRVRDGKPLPRPVSIIRRGDGETVAIDAESYESLGTTKFLSILGPLIYALSTGATLVIDEFDASIHPMVIANIINIFHNDEINRNGAQLIFNTHNPIFLNRSLFREDEIKFVERDEETGHSQLYALSDFEATDGRDISDYMKNYFVGRYGAIREVELSDIFEELLRKGGDVDEA